MKIYPTSKDSLRRLTNIELIERYGTQYSLSYPLIKKGDSKNKERDQVLSELEKIIEILVARNLDQTLNFIDIFNSKLHDLNTKEKYEAATILRDEKELFLETVFKLRKIPRVYLEEVGIN